MQHAQLGASAHLQVLHGQGCRLWQRLRLCWNASCCSLSKQEHGKDTYKGMFNTLAGQTQHHSCITARHTHAVSKHGAVIASSHTILISANPFTAHQLQYASACGRV